MRLGMSSVDPGINLGAVNEHNQRRRKGLRTGAEIGFTWFPLGPG